MKRTFRCILAFSCLLLGSTANKSLAPSAFIISSSRAKNPDGRPPILLFAMKGPEVQPPNRPNGSTYWVSTNLMAGEYPGSKRGEEETRARLRNYFKSGITFFLDLTQDGEREDYYDIMEEEAKKANVKAIYKRIPIRDFGIPNQERMKKILDTIDEAVAANEKVYVHCRGGIGRTGTVVGCYLARKGNPGEQALQEVNRLFQSSDRSSESYYSPETKDQMDFVRNWKET